MNLELSSKTDFSISKIGQFHFWTSVLVGSLSAILYSLLVNLFIKFFVSNYWIDEVKYFLYKQERGKSLWDFYDGEILVFANFQDPTIISFHKSFAFVSVALGLAITTRLLLSTFTPTSTKSRHKRDWSTIILHNHIWNTFHFFIKCFFAISFFGAITAYINLHQLFLIHILVFVYFYFLSIHALNSQFRIKKWAYLIFFYCLGLIWGIGQFCKPDYSNLPEAFKNYKLNIQEHRKQERENFFDIEIPHSPPPENHVN